MTKSNIIPFHKPASTPAKPKKARGNFFAVDRRAWTQACALGINAMVAYLILASGTSRDLRSTTWSAKAIERYTRISRHNATKAIAALIAGGLVRRTSTVGRPQYWLVPAHEIEGCAAAAANGAAAADEADPSTPDWIWLPKSLIEGAKSEVPPVERLRQTQKPQNLQLLVDLYHAHDLPGSGGINWRSIRQEFSRVVVGRQGPFVIWGFEPGDMFTWAERQFVQPYMKDKMENIQPGKWRQDNAGWTVFWTAWGQLVDLGLVEMVGTLIDADTENGSVIHPYAIGNGEPEEMRVAVAAHDAAAELLTPWQVHKADGLHLAPLMKHVGEAQMVGVARLRYKPNTSATQVWIGKMQEWDALAKQLDSIRLWQAGALHLPVGDSRAAGGCR